MMDDRKKLIELIRNAYAETTLYSSIGRQITKMPHRIVGNDTDCVILADILIDNGVTIQRKGHWYGEGDGYADGELVYDVWYCSECNNCIDDGTDNPDLLPKFCSECGAKMDGVGYS